MLCAMACVENKILRRAKNIKRLERNGVVATTLRDQKKAIWIGLRWLARIVMPIILCSLGHRHPLHSLHGRHCCRPHLEEYPPTRLSFVHHQ